MKLVTVEEMRTIEREADARGWTYANMMDEAGRGLANVVQSYYGYAEDLFAIGLVGSGNNGGDTLIALAELADLGWKTAAYLASKRPEDDPLIERIRMAEGLVASVATDPEYHLLDTWMQDASVLVDGILGTGIQLPLRGDTAGLLAHVRDAAFCPPVVAVDCPSGVDCDSGLAAPECITAEVTVCMAAIKIGLLRFPAFQLVGELQIVPIGIPDGLDSWDQIQREVIDEEFVQTILPLRSDEGHKGTFGTAVIAAGSLNYPGAALLAGKASLRMGVGLVTLAVAAPIQTALVGHIPEATWLLLAHQTGCLSGDGVPVLIRGLEKADAFLFGPGFGLEDCTADFVRKLIGGGLNSMARGPLGFVGSVQSEADEPKLKNQKSLPPLVVDADGLKLLARIPDWAEKLPPESVLTPHPGEMAIMTQLGTEEIQADRIGIAARFAQKWGHVVVLKGAFTVIAGPDGRVGVVPVATSALAHAGTGDVLAGIITGLRALGIDAYEAAAAGAWLHARAGLAAGDRLGHPACVTASEVVNSLPEILSFVWQQ
jgi:ADP-dependent NAD(P)H-hydrate dehydratase / NAD(P)H-hydrate epimerase